MMDMPSAHLPYRPAPNGPTSPDPHQHSFDDTAYFSPGSPGLMVFPVSRVTESSLHPWLMMDTPGSASPNSSRLSMSPSQGMATPPSVGFYSPPYPEQLPSPAFQLLDQPQPVRSDLTSHPNWASSDDNWERNYVEDSMWSTQPFVAQPWLPATYDDYAPSDTHLSHAQVDQSHLPVFSFAAQIQFQVQEPMQTEVPLDAAAGASGDANNDANSSDEESDSDDDSDYSQSSSHTSARRKATAPGSRGDRWFIPAGAIQQSSTRGYTCHVPDCPGSFLRPEHLRRHIRSKHCPQRDYACDIPGCNTFFSRGDNLRDHYWTHLQRGGRNGKNKKFTLIELRALIPKEKKLLKRLREKLRQHQEKEQRKQQQLRAGRQAVAERAKL